MPEYMDIEGPIGARQQRRCKLWRPWMLPVCCGLFGVLVALVIGLAVYSGYSFLCGGARSYENQFLVHDLPGLPANASLYAGRLKSNVGPIVGDDGVFGDLFFMLQLANSKSLYSDELCDNTPLVIWFNGGPGCSSMFGALGELGRWIPQADGTLKENEWAWTKSAHMLFVESPVGVGFSRGYTDFFDEDSLYTGAMNDRLTASLNDAFIHSFFEEFRQLQNCDVYLAGESYAGHYVPQLAERLDASMADDDTGIKLKGFLVGNPLTDAAIDFNSTLPTLFSQAMIPRASYLAAQTACDGDFFTCYADPGRSGCEACVAAGSHALNQSLAFNSPLVDPYNLLADVCDPHGSAQAAALLRAHFGFDAPLSLCIQGHISSFLNTVAVQHALHVDPPQQWQMCRNVYGDDRSDVYDSVVPIYNKLKGRYRILVFSGDVDGVVPTLGTQAWLETMNLAVDKPWRQWIGSDNQPAGYVTQYEDGISFATVKAAGHEVPRWQPQHALDMFTRFIQDEEL